MLKNKILNPNLLSLGLGECEKSTKKVISQKVPIFSNMLSFGMFTEMKDKIIKLITIAKLYTYAVFPCMILIEFLTPEVFLILLGHEIFSSSYLQWHILYTYITL